MKHNVKHNVSHIADGGELTFRMLMRCLEDSHESFRRWRCGWYDGISFPEQQANCGAWYLVHRAPRSVVSVMEHNSSGVYYKLFLFMTYSHKTTEFNRPLVVSCLIGINERSVMNKA